MEKLYLLTQHLNYAKTIGGMSTIAHLCAKKANMTYREIDRNKVFQASVNPAHSSKLAIRFYLIAQVESSSFSQFLVEQGISGIQLMKDSNYLLYLNISTTIDMIDDLVSRLQDFEEICISVLKR